MTQSKVAACGPCRRHVRQPAPLSVRRPSAQWTRSRLRSFVTGWLMQRWSVALPYPQPVRRCLCSRAGQLGGDRNDAASAAVSGTARATSTSGRRGVSLLNTILHFRLSDRPAKVTTCWSSYTPRRWLDFLQVKSRFYTKKLCHLSQSFSLSNVRSLDTFGS